MAACEDLVLDVREHAGLRRASELLAEAIDPTVSVRVASELRSALSLRGG